MLDEGIRHLVKGVQGLFSRNLSKRGKIDQMACSRPHKCMCLCLEHVLTVVGLLQKIMDVGCLIMYMYACSLQSLEGGGRRRSHKCNVMYQLVHSLTHTFRIIQHTTVTTYHVQGFVFTQINVNIDSHLLVRQSMLAVVKSHASCKVVLSTPLQCKRNPLCSNSYATITYSSLTNFL